LSAPNAVMTRSIRGTACGGDTADRARLQKNQ
jgi:hypothetical protein